MEHPEVFMIPRSMPTPRSSRPTRGCYGFRLAGVEDAAELLVDAPAEWPELRIECGPARGDPPPLDSIGPDRAELPLQSGGWVELERESNRVAFSLPGDPPDRDLVHPYLAPAAAVAARWAGRESFHAGALIAGGGAWGLLGDKETGKSSTAGLLAVNGHAILTDDLLVLDGQTAFAGPRCIDLREAPASRLGAGEPMGVVGLRERWRLTLPPVPAAVPLRGWVTLEWGERVAIERLEGPERLLALLPFRTVQIAPAEPQELVRLSSLPVLRLSRPREWAVLPEAVERLLGAVGA
jgi:hypothetical protein